MTFKIPKAKSFQITLYSAFSDFEYNWYPAFSVFSRKIWHMTKILRKREGQRWIQPPAAPVSLRLEAKVVTMTYRAPWDV